MKKLSHWLPSLIWMGVIYYLSGRTGKQLSAIFPFLKDFNWGHFLAYFILSSFYYYALTSTASLRNIPLWSVFLCLIYGITDEYHQSFVPGRTPEISDIINDLIGSTLAAALIYLYQKKKAGAKSFGDS